MIEVSDELWGLVASLLDLSVDRFAAGESNPIIMLMLGAGQTHIIYVEDVQGNVTPRLVEHPKHLVSESFGKVARLYAVAFDGYLTTDGERSDAAFVEAGERGQPEAVVFAQRYRVKKRSGKVERVKRPLLVQAAKQLLR